jgi:hypothetical protein
MHVSRGQSASTMSGLGEDKCCYYSFFVRPVSWQ